jgi:hypothetical protein
MSKDLSEILPFPKPNRVTDSRNVFLTFVIAIVLLCMSYGAKSQKLSGQWIGEFGDASDVRGVKTTYVLELEVNGQQISGYSYTYFTISGKRYYVICKLKGQYEQGSKSLLVNEVENIKSNTPPDFQNCLQSHQLTYFKQNDREVLLGKWKPFEKGSNCGSGLTELERKMIPGLKTTESQTKVQSGKSKPESLANPVPQQNDSEVNKINESTEEKKPITTKPSQTAPQNRSESNIVIKPNLSIIEENKKAVSEKSKEKLTKRNYQIIKTIELTDDKLKVEIYDNGQIDGDTVSIFLNEKLLVPARMLTAKPITLDIKITDDEDTYDLIMYAESLGTIPPNTALMIVTTSKNRYEINITSTEQTSGVIRFKIKREP